MVEDTSVAQARVLISSLHKHIDATSKAIEKAERQLQRAPHGSARQNQRQRVREMQKELHEAYRLIQNLHQRFPRVREGRPQVSLQQLP